MTKIGPRKHWSGGTRMWFSQTFVLTDYDNRSVFGDKNNEEDDTPPQNDQSSVARLASQRAARRQAAAAQSCHTPAMKTE